MALRMARLTEPISRKEMAAWISAAFILGVFSIYSSQQDAVEFAKLQQQVSDTHTLSAKTLDILATKSGANSSAGPDVIVNAAAAKIDALGSQVGELQKELAQLEEPWTLTAE